VRLVRTVPWVLSLGVLAASIAVRVWHRGDYIPGWDVLGAAQGLVLVSTRTPAEIFEWYRVSARSPAVFWNLYGLPSVLLPGMLASVWPWQFWNHAVVLALSAVVLWLTASAFGLGRRDAWVVPLAWSTSSTVVSQSVAGLPYLTCLVPHALAVWTVLRLSARPLTTVVLAGVVFLVGLQVQELGRTACLVFLAATVAAPGRWPTRLVWLAAGVLMMLDSVRHPTANTQFFSDIGVPALRDVVAALGGVASRLFVAPSLDLPVPFVAALVALVALRRTGWLWRLLFGAQLALVVVLELKRPGGVWPRRFLLVDLYALLPVVALFAQWRAAGRTRAAAALVGLLALGAAWQLADTVAFARRPFPLERWAFTLPFADTTVDYQVTLEDGVWTRRMLDEAQAGRKLILAYNFSSYNENATNPSGIPERLYVGLGHRRFVDSVYFFGTAFRWDDLRARPLDDIDAFVAGIRDPADYVGWYAVHPMDVGNAVREQELDRLFAALSGRFTIVWEPSPPGLYELYRFTLAPLPPQRADFAPP